MFFSPYFEKVWGLLFDSKPTILARIWILTVNFSLQSEKCMMEFERRKKNQGQFIIDFHERFALVSDILSIFCFPLIW